MQPTTWCSASPIDLRDVQGMRVESVRRILDAAQTMMDELARAAPDDLQLQRSRAAMPC
jgi:hypothetical protein